MKAAVNEYRAKAFECLSLAECMNDPPRSSGLPECGWSWPNRLRSCKVPMSCRAADEKCANLHRLSYPSKRRKRTAIFGGIARSGALKPRKIYRRALYESAAVRRLLEDDETSPPAAVVPVPAPTPPRAEGRPEPKRGIFSWFAGARSDQAS